MISEKTITQQKITPYSWQKSIIAKLKKYFTKNNKGILTMPCRTGKTLISCYLGKQYKHLIFISPLKQFAQQNKQRYKEYDSDRKGLLIDSDGIRDIHTIKKFIKKDMQNIWT